MILFDAMDEVVDDHVLGQVDTFSLIHRMRPGVLSCGHSSGLSLFIVCIPQPF